MKIQCAVLGVMTLLLAGCSSDSEPEVSTTPLPQAKMANSADPTARMARAVGAGKPGAAIDIKYEFADKPAVGKPVEVELALIPNAGVNSLDIVVGGMEGITLAGNLNATFADVKVGQTYKHQVSLLADREGVFYLTVAATTHIGGATMGRTFSIPFVVGTPAPKEAVAAPQKDAAGQAVQSMPAQETTR